MADLALYGQVEEDKHELIVHRGKIKANSFQSLPTEKKEYSEKWEVSL